MGISPDDTFTYWLPADASKPEGERRGLVYLHNTAGHWRRFTADKEKAEKLPHDQYFPALLELLTRGLVNRVNVPVDIDDSMTLGELIEAVDDLRFTSALTELEKKRSSRQPPSVAASSVKPA